MLLVLKRTLKKLVNLLGYEISHSDPTINNDDRFRNIYNKCKDYTMASKERMYALYKAVEFIVNSKISGDFVECGVWRGGSVMMIACTLLEMNETSRKIYLYDKFEEMSEPTEDDHRISNKNKWCVSLSEVKKNMLLTGYPKNNIVFVKGKVEDTIPKITPKKIVLLKLDINRYESTKHELTHLFPLLTRNGVLIIDVYGRTGSKKAVDEYFLNKQMLLNRIDYTGRIGIKIE